VKGISNAFTAATNQFGNYIVGCVFLIMNETVTGKILSSFMVTGFNLITFFFIYYMNPETKGK
jgi:hypothetical protein